MKNSKHVLFIFAFLLNAIFSKAQTPKSYYSPEALFDSTIVDNYGSRYTLNDLIVDTVSSNGSGMRTTLAACSGTNAGYFDLYLQPGCGFEPIPGNPTQSAINAARLSILCQVYIDISNFITNRGGLSNRVRICVKDITSLIPTAAVSLTGAMGGSYYSYPYSTSLGGIIDNEIWKTINSGQDSYIGITSPLIATSGFYHGFMSVNFANTTLPWHTNLLTACATGTLDLYSFCLHEITHSLGFSSFINYNGNSTIPLGANKYSRYDLGLRTQGGLKVITNSGGCSLYNYSVNPTFSNPTRTLSPGSATCGSLPYSTNADVTTCSTSITYSNSLYNVNVYTPNCFEAGSSLSHFEDMCYPTNTPSNNNTYFVMSNIINYGSTKRYLKEEERKVLCDIGYTVASTYGTSTYTTTQKTYTAGACNGISIIGVNDGLSSLGVYIYTANVSSSTGTIQPLTNDIGTSGATYECLEVIVGSGALSATSGNLSTPFTYTPYSGGVSLLRYVPVSSTGVRGNIAYIYVKVIGVGTCSVSPPNNCEMVYNGGFESTNGVCGWSNYPPQSYETHLNCWDLYSGGYWDYYRTCTTQPYGPAGSYTLPTGSFDAWNPSSNNSVFVSSHYWSSWPMTPSNVLLGSLTSSLVPTAQYKVSFWAIDLMPTTTSYASVPQLTIHIAGSPAGIVGPIPIATYPAPTFSVLTSYPVPRDGQWHNYSALVTYTGGATRSITFLTSQSLTSGSSFAFDDLSILPGSSSSTFTMPTISCTGATYTLNSMVSVPNGTFSGPGVSYSAPNYIFSANTAGNGLQTISYTYTTATGCTLTAIAQTSVTPTPTNITVISNPPAGLCSSYPTATLTATGASTYSWNPGALTGSTVSVSPTSLTVYTVVGANATCSLSTTYTVNYTSTCVCTAANTMPTTLNTVTLNASEYAITNNVTVTGGNVMITSPDVRCSPGVSITVASGATLTITQSHFYSCFDMWQGIDILPGGYLIINTSLIEDAQQAVRIYSNTSTSGTVLDVSTTVFNRNQTSIAISNYTQTISTYPFSVKSSIFTSRDFTFTSTSWPSQGTLSQTCTTSNPLASPNCIGNYSVINMKSPNNTTPAYYGITLNSVGATINPSTTPTYYSIQIGVPASTVNANIFDNLLYGISAYNTNLKVAYNQFQNAQSVQIHGNWLGGVGVDAGSDDYNNNYLMVKSPTPYFSLRKNRFFDCNYAVRTTNIFEHDIQYCVVASTQTVSSSYQRGKYGLYLTTNRLRAFDVSNNTIYNIENGIIFNTTYGPINFGASSYTNTQYVNSGNITTNTVSAVISGSQGNNFVQNAITAQNILSTGSTQTVAANLNLLIQNNQMAKVYNGVYASNFSVPPMMIQSNTTSLSIDPSGTLQNGIAIVACTNPSVQLNNVLGINTTNTITTGVYASMNTAPKVTCNTVSTTYQGFEFYSSQAGTKWKGNSMTTHTLGMTLTSSTIGAQGSAGNPIDNVWNGTWTTPNFNTWTNSSTVTASPLYVQSATGVYYPGNNSGSPQPASYWGCCVNVTNGSYSCANGGARLMATSDPDYDQTYLNLLETVAAYPVMHNNNTFDPNEYIAQYQLYRNIDSDPTSYLTSKTLSDFYYNNKNSAYGKLADGQNNLISGNYSSAVSLLNGLSSKNNIENNYYDFYNFYSKYYTNIFSDQDNKSLSILANKCPLIEGEVIYQARALYNIINSTVETFKNNCPDNSSERLGNIIKSVSNWNVNIYPNPANSELFISSSTDKEDIKVSISDVNGRNVGEYNVKTNGFTANIKLNMNSGIYFVTLSNSNDKVVKKLVITK